MSECRWKPGDVAMVSTEDGERIAFRCGLPSNMGWQYAREVGQPAWNSDTSGYVQPLRRLAVIDYEDRAEVERLANLLDKWDYAGSVEYLQSALREFATPRPRIDEPTGRGAVVEDSKGGWWVRGEQEGTSFAWVGPSAYWKNWDELEVVRVLSEGVQ